MPQSFPTTPEDIFNVLSQDTEFMSNIGSYQFRSGADPVPAISIITPNEKIPGASVTNGLECLIHDSTSVKNRNFLTGDNKSTIPWKVFLIVWPPANGSDLMAATLRLLEIYPNAISNETMRVDNALGALAQTQFTIPSDGPTLL